MPYARGYVTPDGDALAKLREDAGLSQRALGDICKLSRETISKIETGGTSSVMTRTVRKLARALRVEVSALLIDQESEEVNIGRVNTQTFVAVNGRLVAAHRRTACMTQLELAQKCHLSRATIEKIERAVPELECRVRPSTLRIIAKTLKRDFGSLVDTENQPDFLQDYYETESEF